MGAKGLSGRQRRERKKVIEIMEWLEWRAWQKGSDKLPKWYTNNTIWKEWKRDFGAEQGLVRRRSSSGSGCLLTTNR